MKDIEIIDIDYSAKDPTFKKEDKVEVDKISGPWIIPEEGPVYAESVRVLKGGLDLIPETDFEVVDEVTDLTLKTGKKVCLYVKLLPHVIAGGGELDMIYQRVGLPIISVKKLLETLEEMIIKGKPVDWETGVANKPKTQYPSWHSHDIQNPDEMIGFGGLVELFSRLTWEQGNEGSKMQALLQKLQTELYAKLNYTLKLKWAAIMGHSRNYNNPHGVVPSHVESGNIQNYATATPQEDSEAKREDLRSTPAGLTRLISEQSPETEDYLVQNELPFGYYGSGIYLPPPITGSFEGLGSDIENSMFVREGNGWTVGLIRGYDGRVKNLYYIYTEDIVDRSGAAPWLHTYVQYVHPAITAAGKTANIVINGSNQSIICVGDVQTPGSNMIKGQDKFWIGLTNSTLDPGSHTLKPINLVDVVVDLAMNPTKEPGRGSIYHVGDWVYYIHSVASFEGDLPANYNAVSGGTQNWQQRMWRFRYSDLSNNAVTSITLQPVNVNFDNLDREYRTNQPAMFLIKQKWNAQNQILEGAIKFSKPMVNTDSHRRRQFFVVPNPNNPRYAKVKVLIVTYSNVRNTDNDGLRGLWQDLTIDYEWDVETNTWRIDNNWRKPTLNVDTNVFSDINSPWNQTGGHSIHTSQFAWTAGSWIPGVGFVSLETRQTGTPPFNVGVSLINPEGDPSRDYYWMNQPIRQTDAVGRFNAWTLQMKMKSPFGVAGFPRMYADVWQTTDGLRTNPIEMFYAEDEDQNQRHFYRITEGGTGDNFDFRDTLQSDFIDRPIYGRKTNSSFGRVNGMTNNIGFASRPRRKNGHSRGTGLFGYYRSNLRVNPSAAPVFTWRIDNNGNQITIPIETNGDLIINVNMDYRLDGPTKILFVRPNKAKQVRVPRSIWQDMVNSALGSHAAKVIDTAVSFYISDMPGSGGDQPYSMWSIHYHITDNPEITRSIVGLFTWSVASTNADGIRVIKLDNMQYPFIWGTNANYPLRPGTENNITGISHHALEPNGRWTVLQFASGLGTRVQHMEILDFESEGAQNVEQCYMNALQVNVPGNMTSPRVFFRRRKNVIVEASLTWGANNAFNNEYTNQVQANGQWGWLSGANPSLSGGAINLMEPWDGNGIPLGAVRDKYIMLGATYVEGNWSVFVNSEVTVTFNGFSMMAKLQNWDLRDLSDVYKNQTFYIYCCANGSAAYYEVTKILRNHDANKILVATVKTDDFGIVTIDRRQTFTISGFPITLARDMGVPASSGAVTEQGTYKFLKRSELFSG